MEHLPLLLRIIAAALFACSVVLFIESARKRRPLICVISAVMALIAFLLYPAAPPEQAAPNDENPAFIREQMSIADWYNDYKRVLDRLNNNWYQYHKTVDAFAANEISVQTARIRITELYTAAHEADTLLSFIYIPDNLSDANHNCVISILNKTKEYAAEQIKIFEQSVYTIDANNIELYPTHEEQVYNLKKLMVIEKPLTLDVSPDIAALKDNLR
jgi:hypothetical protein